MPASEKSFAGGVGKPIDDARREIFHILSPKVYFYQRKARPDIQQAIAVLTIRGKEPNKAD